MMSKYDEWLKTSEIAKLMALRHHHQEAAENLRTLFPYTRIWTTAELIQEEMSQLACVETKLKKLLQG